MKRARNEGGYTLVEMMIAACVSSLLLATVVVGSIALRRTFEAADYHVGAQNDQLRIFDYLGRDLRAASAVAVLDGGRRLDLTVPGGGTDTLAMHLELPVLGSLHTTSAGSAREVSYFVEGDRLLRCEGGKSKEIARTITDLRLLRSGATMEISATFSPRFSRSPIASVQEPTRLRTTFLLRNATGG